jgi:two-component system LytT family response regulator
MTETELCRQYEDVQIVAEPESGATRSRSRVLVGERQRRLYPLDVEKIDYIEADGNYVTIRIGTCDYIRRDSIKRLAACLAEWGFMRIERSLLLNIRAVVYAEIADRGSFAFTLSSGACVQSSASYRDAILDVIPLVRRKERSNLSPVDA